MFARAALEGMVIAGGVMLARAAERWVAGLDERAQLAEILGDQDAVKRQAIALVRDHPFEGVVDAYLLWRDLCVVLGDMSIRCFPVSQVGGLAALSAEDLEAFSIHPSGSYLVWQKGDLRLGPSQFLQAVDPMYLADVLIDRYAIEKVSLALRVLRESMGLTQSDIMGLSDRHVRRLEREEVRLTSNAAEKYSAAFGYSLEQFLAELSSTVSRLEASPAERLRA